MREHGLHPDRPVEGEQRALAKARCRSGTSFACGKGQRTLADGFGRKEQRLADVVSFEVWVQREDALAGALGVATSAVSVKATRPEGLGLLGDGIGCLAVAVLA